MTQEELFRLRQTGAEVQRILDAEGTMAEQTAAAVGAAESANEAAQQVNDALQEIIETGDIPAATVAKVAEHTVQIGNLKALIFDISANNPTEGHPTPYANLAAALGEGGVNVPESMRKGGMSVKFIQGTEHSSDNKYVQFRCMANAFTTDVTQWQGIDEEITDKSHNLIESGAVYGEIVKIAGGYASIIDSDYQVFYGDKGWNANLQEGGDISWERWKFDVSTLNGRYVKVTAHPTPGCYCGFLMNNGATKDKWATDGTKEIKIPNGAQYLCVSHRKYQYSQMYASVDVDFAGIVGRIDNEIKTSNNKISNILSDIYGSNYGKFQKLSIIGDDISTYAGLNGYKSYYPIGEIDSIDKTYWHIFKENLGITEIQNLSASSSSVGSTRTPSLYTRAQLVDNDADLIVIALGSYDTDAVTAQSVGTLDYDKEISSYDETIFTEAYLKGLRTLMASNPNATFILVALKSYSVVTMDFRALAIADIAKHYGLLFLDARNLYVGEASPNAQRTQSVSDMKNIAVGLLDTLGTIDTKGLNSKTSNALENIEQVKQENDYRYEENIQIQQGIDISLYENNVEELYITNDNTWAVNTGEKSYVIPYVSSMGKILVCARKQGASYSVVSFVKEINRMSGSPVVFSGEGVQMFILDTNNLFIKQIPSDTKYIIVQKTISGDVDITPEIKFNKYNTIERMIDYDSNPQGVLYLENFTTWISTARNYVLKEEEIDNKKYLYFSDDLGETWSTGILNNLGDNGAAATINFVHWFSDGSCLIATPAACYYTNDYTTIQASTLLEYDGTPLQIESSEWHFNMPNSHDSAVCIIDGVEYVMWGDYCGTNTYSSVWMSDDYGHTVKRMLLSGVSTIVDVNGNSVPFTINHVHRTSWDNKQKCYWITTGDYGTKDMLIKATCEQGVWTFTCMLTGDYAKFIAIFTDDVFLYAMTDYSDTSLSNGLLRCPLDKITDINSFKYVWKVPNEDKTSMDSMSCLSNYFEDDNGNRVILGDDHIWNKLWYANKGVDFKPVELYSSGVYDRFITPPTKFCVHYFIGPNYNGDIIASLTTYGWGGGRDRMGLNTSKRVLINKDFADSFIRDFGKSNKLT